VNQSSGHAGSRFGGYRGLALGPGAWVGTTRPDP
jgi:hypothetical protein